jgi:iron complex transport system ATP-binding protein
MTPALHIENLTISRGKKILCRVLTMTIKPNDFWAILGPNGSGKTTLLQTLSGHLAPAHGKILLNKQPLTAHSSRLLAQHIGILFQDSAHTFPQTVYEYCRAARFPHQALISSRCHQTDDRITRQTLKLLELDNLADKNIQHLSGGEQRRAAIAALLVQSPAFYLLDEPANHLDLHHQMQMMQIFADLAHIQHRAVIMSLHDINLAARYCNKILMLFPDGSTQHGSRADMLNTENLSRLYQHPIDVIRDGEQTYWLPNKHRHPRESGDLQM